MLDPFSGPSDDPSGAAQTRPEGDWDRLFACRQTRPGNCCATTHCATGGVSRRFRFRLLSQRLRTVGGTSAPLRRGVVLKLVGDRYGQTMDEFYPVVGGPKALGYCGLSRLPCRECGSRFPLTGSPCGFGTLSLKGRTRASRTEFLADRQSGTPSRPVGQNSPLPRSRRS